MVDTLRGLIRRAGSVLRSDRRGGKAVEDSRMTLVEHLKELRRRLLFALVAVGVATMVVAVWGYHAVFDILRQPYCHLPPQRRMGGFGCDLIFTHPTDAFFIRLKVSLVAGVVLAAPFWLYQLWAFITPGLHRNERRWGIAFVLSSLVLFAAGTVLSYLVLGPALDVLLGFAGNGVTPLLEVNQYVSFVMAMLVIFGTAFEFPLVLILLNLAGVVSSRRLRSWRRVAIFLLFVFAGFATPTQDPFSMLALAAPLCLFYEAAILVSRWNDKRRAERDELAAFADLPDDEASPLGPRPTDLPDDVPSESETQFASQPREPVGARTWDEDST